MTGPGLAGSLRRRRARAACLLRRMPLAESLPDRFFQMKRTVPSLYFSLYRRPVEWQSMPVPPHPTFHAS